MYENPTTTRPDLIGKTIVVIIDPRWHGDGQIPPSVALGKIVAAEDGYARMLLLKLDNGRVASPLLDIHATLDPCYDDYEPGEKLEEYMPGSSAIFGQPDFVLNLYQRRLMTKRKFDEARRSFEARVFRTPTG